MADWWDSSNFKGSADQPAETHWWDRDWGHTADVVSDQVRRGMADIPGMVGDAVVQPVEDLGNLPSKIKQIYHAVTGQTTPEDKQAIRDQATKPGPVSGRIQKMYNNILGPEEEPTDTIDKYAGAVARGAGASVFTPNVPGVLSTIGANVGGQAGSDLFPDNAVAPLIGSIVGSAAGGVPHAAENIRGGNLIIKGAQHPDFETLFNQGVLPNEGGGTIENPKTSKKGAEGPAQVMPDTQKDPGYGIRPSNGTQTDNLRVGRQYFAAMLGKYDDPEKALAAYNWGPGHVDHALSKYGEDWLSHAPDETQKYVDKAVNRVYGSGENGSTGGSVPPMNPSAMADAMADPEAAGAPRDNTVDFPQEDQPASIAAEDVLTPSERQEMDASADITPMDSSHEKFTQYPRETTPANENVGQSPQDIQLEQQLNTPENIAEAKRIHADAFSEAMGEPLPDDYNSAVIKQKGGTGRKFNKTPEEMSAVLEHADQKVSEFWNSKLEEAKQSQSVGDGQLPPQEPPASGGGNGEGPKAPDPSYEGLDPEEKLTKALKEAKPVSGAQKRAYSEERSARAAKLASIQGQGEGLKGLHTELSNLKGELPHVDYESIAHNFTPNDVDTLLNRVKGNNWLLPFEKLTAQQSLMKLLGSEGSKVPTPAELKLLSHIFPEDMIQAMMKNRPFMTKFWDGVANALNVPRTLMASFDLSAPLRQGVFFVGRKEFYPAFAKMFHLFGDKEAFNALKEEIQGRPTYPLMRRAGLAITDMGHILSQREEAFMSSWAEKIPLVGMGVKASERAYEGFLNKIRADTFDSLVKLSREAGVDLEHDGKALKDIAHFINNATGRGDVPTWMGGNTAAPMLSGLFFSPRLMASRVTMLNPAFYLRLSPVVRKEAIKSLLSFSAIALTVLGLAKAGGASVGVDPRSADFGKIRVGDTRYDILGGFQQYIRFGAEMISGKTVNSHGHVKSLTSGKFGQDTRLDVVEKFFENKFSPVASFIADGLRGKDAVGNKFDLKSEVAQRFIPLVAQDTADAYKEYGAKGLLSGVPGVFGVGVQTYKAKPKKARAKKSGDWWDFK